MSQFALRARHAAKHYSNQAQRHMTTRTRTQTARLLCLFGTTGSKPLQRPSLLGSSRGFSRRYAHTDASQLSAAPPSDSPSPRFKDQHIQAWSASRNGFVTLPNIWLRDNCQCSACVHDATKQRLLDTFSIPPTIAIQSGEQRWDGISVTWDDGHQSHFPNKWLAKSTQPNDGVLRQASTNITLWTSAIREKPPTVQYKDVMGSENGVREWLSKIREYGFCYVEGTPAEPAATQATLERIAFIRITHYGGFYDFTADLSSKDTAYTNIALDAHTDNTYFSDPAGLQAFHLLSHTDGKGGASLLVDGFRAAAELKKLDPGAYELLSTVGVQAHASGNEGISIQPYRTFPVLLHAQTQAQTQTQTQTQAQTHAGVGGTEKGHRGELMQVRWNSSDRAAVDMPVENVQAWYDAARKWAQILKSSEAEYWCQLQPGKLLVFDNWRVLHGRSAFTGKRRIAGAYINRDDWISRFRSLNWGHDRVLNSLVTGLD